MANPDPPSGIATQVRRRIRALLAEREMDVIDLAKKVGWSRSAASRRLGRCADPTPLSIAEIEAVALALDVPVAVILPTGREQVAA